jgi:hypothetical protein
MDKDKIEVKAQPEEPKPVKVQKPVAVRIIRDNGPTVLVEWAVGSKADPDWRRAYIPKEVIHDLQPDRNVGSVQQAELDAGTPYGVRWEELAVVTATPQKIGMELRRRGLWTVRDCEWRVAEAQAAFVAACSADFGALLQAARKLEEDK